MQPEPELALALHTSTPLFSGMGELSYSLVPTDGDAVRPGRHAVQSRMHAAAMQSSECGLRSPPCVDFLEAHEDTRCDVLGLQTTPSRELHLLITGSAQHDDEAKRNGVGSP